MIARGLIKYTLLIPIVTLIMICPLAAQKSEGISVIATETPIYKIAISEDTQRDIWKLCEKNQLSYELVLAIYKIDDIENTQAENIKAEIEELVYFRDYWADQGFSDEIVFDLMLISNHRGLEACRLYMQDNNDYYLDDYVQKVLEYKYYLEQSLDD
jgi:hypothetical protein